MKRDNMCNHELKRLFYTSDDDYGIQTCKVELENEDDKYTLCYCEKCGQVFVMEIAEKRMNYWRNLHLSTAKSRNITVMREDKE